MTVEHGREERTPCTERPQVGRSNSRLVHRSDRQSPGAEAGNRFQDAALQKVLIQRNLATEEQIDQALAIRGDVDSDLGEVLVADALSSLHEISSMCAPSSAECPSLTCDRHNPQPEALALIPDSIAREHFIIP